MIEEIHFLYNEIEDKLNRDVEKLLFQIKNPLAGKKMGVLTEITRHIILARARQLQAEEEQRNNEMIAAEQMRRESLEESGALPSSKFKASINVAGITEKKTEMQIPQSGDEHEDGMVKVTTINLVIDNNSSQVLAKADVSDEIYYVYEPDLNEWEAKLLRQAEKDIGHDYSILESNKSLMKQMYKSAKVIKTEFFEENLLKMKYYLVRNIAGYNVVEPLAHDKSIQKIICNGTGEAIEVIRNGSKIKTNALFTGRDELNSFLIEIAKKTFQNVSIEEPVLDAVFRGFRIQGILGTETVPTRFIMTRV